MLPTKPCMWPQVFTIESRYSFLLSENLLHLLSCLSGLQLHPGGYGHFTQYWSSRSFHSLLYLSIHRWDLLRPTVNHSVLCYCWLRRTLWLWDGSPQLTDGPSGGPSIVAPDHLLLLTLIQKRKKHLSIFESTVSLVQTQTAFELATTEKTAREATSTALIDGHRRAHGCPSANWRRLRQCCQLSHLSS